MSDGIDTLLTNISGLLKQAEDNLSRVSFPTASEQQMWRIGKAKNRLKIQQGNSVFHFDAPAGIHKNKSFPLIRLEDQSLEDFNKDVKHTHNIQVHKSDPLSVYFTVQDGKSNPTYSIEHEREEHWKAIPKLNKRAGIVDSIFKGTYDLGKKAVNTAMLPGLNPWTAAGVGLGAGALYDLGKRSLYNTKQENENETVKQRALRYIAPAGALGLFGGLQRAAFGHKGGYYDLYPLYKL